MEQRVCQHESVRKLNFDRPTYAVIKSDMAQLLDGKKSAQNLLDELKATISTTLAADPSKEAPCLAILQVGANPASAAYIRRKIKIADEIGASTKHISLSSDTSEEEIRRQVKRLAEDSAVDALIVQLPLDQKQVSSSKWVHETLEMIPPVKDADGLHTQNLGHLAAGSSTPSHWTAPLPATAYGIMDLLNFYKVPLLGKRILILGKSRLVGMPTAQLLMHAGGTVSVAHSKSGDWSDLSRNADVIVAAAGVKHLLKPEQIKEGVVLVDVGIHRDEDGLTGDIDHGCYEKAGSYSPVPGGVGQMTVACLMANLVNLWK